MTRKEKLLLHVSQGGRGVEIGPSYNPLAPKREGYRVTTLDTLDREGLRAKYAAHQVDIDRIEEVDCVWKGERYADLIPRPHDFDWILASHVIEHTPDLIGFLEDCSAILGPGGVLSLAIPDKRRCFDRYRPISGLGQVIDRHVTRAKSHTVGSIVEFMLNAVARNGQITWDATTRGTDTFLCGLEQVQAHLREGRQRPLETDVHAWCFTPSSFRLLLADLHLLGLTTFRERDFHPTEGSEFFVTLANGGDLAPTDRLQLLHQVEAELADSVPR